MRSSPEGAIKAVPGYRRPEEFANSFVSPGGAGLPPQNGGGRAAWQASGAARDLSAELKDLPQPGPSAKGSPQRSECIAVPLGPVAGETGYYEEAGMTKDGDLKRTARERARRTGESYAKVRADMEREEVALARRILGEEPVSIEQVLVSGRGFNPPYVHRVRTKRQLVYLKHGAASETGWQYALEAWAYRLCRSHGIPVPEVVDAADHGDELDYIASVELPGASLWTQPPSRRDLPGILRDAGERLRAMHEIELEGYGPIISPGRGGHSTWWRPFLEQARNENLPFLVDCGALTSSDADAIERQLTDALELIPAEGPRRLLHGNLEGDHLFADGGRFTGFIDFGDMQSGDPAFDLARLAWWDAAMVAPLLDGYGHDVLTDDDLNVRMPAYLLANATRVVGEVRAGVRPAPGAANFVNIARAVRFQREGRRVTATAPPPQDPAEILVENVRGRSDDYIDEFAASIGGYGPLCGMVFAGLRALSSPKEDCAVGFVLGELGWVLRSTDGKIKATKRVPKRAAAIVRTSPVDFLRWVTGDLPYASGVADGRITIEGDESQLRVMFPFLVP